MSYWFYCLGLSKSLVYSNSHANSDPFYHFFPLRMEVVAWLWQGSLALLQSVEFQRVRHDLMTKQGLCCCYIIFLALFHTVLPGRYFPVYKEIGNLKLHLKFESRNIVSPIIFLLTSIRLTCKDGCSIICN